MSKYSKFMLTTLCASTVFFVAACGNHAPKSNPTPPPPPPPPPPSTNATSGTLTGVNITDPTGIVTATSPGGISGSTMLPQGTAAYIPISISSPGIAVTDQVAAGGFRDTSDNYQLYGSIVSGDETESFSAGSMALTGTNLNHNTSNTTVMTVPINFGYSVGDAAAGTATNNTGVGLMTVNGDQMTGTIGAVSIEGTIVGQNFAGGQATLNTGSEYIVGNMNGQLSVDADGTFDTPNITETFGTFQGDNGSDISFAGAFQQ